MTPKKASKSMSASEIARNPASFDKWQTLQSCTTASMDDLPDSMRKDLDAVFDVSRSLPISLVDEKSEVHAALKLLTPKLAQFLKDAYRAAPSMFSKKVKPTEHLMKGITAVHLAYEEQNRMAGSSVKWTEADRAGKVYNFIRGPAVTQSRPRLQCPISLSDPVLPITKDGASVVGARTAIPDGLMFLSQSSLNGLVRRKSSEYNRMQRVNVGLPFKENATLTAQLPHRERFEFASSAWEDKKPDAGYKIETAYCQNRMTTTAAARQLHAFGIVAPVVGLVFGDGTVRAHTDWAVDTAKDHTKVYSAPFAYCDEPDDDRRISGMSGASAKSDFHVWDLAKPEDMLAVYLIFRNLDKYTVGPFKDRIIEGITRSAEGAANGSTIKPWKLRRQSRIRAALEDTIKEEPEDEEEEGLDSEKEVEHVAQLVVTASKAKMVTKSPSEENTVKQPVKSKKQKRQLTPTVETSVQLRRSPRKLGLRNRP